MKIVVSWASAAIARARQITESKRFAMALTRVVEPASGYSFRSHRAGHPERLPARSRPFFTSFLIEGAPTLVWTVFGRSPDEVLLIAARSRARRRSRLRRSFPHAVARGKIAVRRHGQGHLVQSRLGHRT